MMQSAQDRPGDVVSAGDDVVVRCAFWDRLTERLVWAALVEVVHVLSEHASKVPFTEQQHVIEALSPEAAEEPLHGRVQVGRQVHPVVMISCEVSTFATDSILYMGAGLSWSHAGTTGRKTGSTATIGMAVSGVSPPLGRA